MNVKYRKTIFFTIMAFLVGSLLTQSVSAAGNTGMFNGMEGKLWDTIRNIMQLPVPALKIAQGETYPNGLPLFGLLLAFTVLFSVLWLASGQVPLFKADENKGARKAFIIAMALLVIFATPFVATLIDLVNTFQDLAMFAMLVLGVYTIWVIFKGGWASNKKVSAEASSTMADASKTMAEADRVEKQATEYEKKTKIASKNGVKKQVQAIRSIKTDLTTLLKEFNTIKSSGMSIVPVGTKNKIIQTVTRISTDAGKIASFKTENDRLIAGMSTSEYRNNPKASSLASKTPSGLINVKSKTDTETNDLGRILSSLAQTIRTQDINSGNINNLLAITANAINITNQMERDVVLEQSMIDKI